MQNFIGNDGKPKSFWERPEGVTGQLVGVGLIVGGIWGISKLLPFIITLLANTIYATLLGIAAACLLYMVFDPRFWRLGGAMYQSAMRKITQLFVEIDPIGIMRNYVDRLESRLEDLSKRIAKLSGMIRQVKEEIESNNKVRDGELKRMNVAQGSGKKMEMALSAREVGRMNETNLTYKDLLTKMELLYRVLTKYQEVSIFLIKDMKSEIKVKETKKRLIDNAFSAIQSAKAIINGDPSSKQMFDMANEFLAADYAMKVGEIEDFARISDGFMQSIDLQNGVYEADALKMLEDWEKNAESLVLGDTKRLMLENSPSIALSHNSAIQSAGVDMTSRQAQREGVDWSQVAKRFDN